MTVPAIHLDHPVTLLRTLRSRSTFRMVSLFREGTDRCFSGPSRHSGRRPAGVDESGSRAA
ncbi:hypothetical protein FHT40_002414 [Mycolicibacterium sp. BK556]|nr:hypothetical protein [Mycolicibacterium sp. BK556]MBB3632946.1 hypothetical protein [Mycolicibacterium sp. BK607]